MEILNSKQMEQADAYTISTMGIPSIVLMENAAQAVFRFFKKLELSAGNIAVVAGGGNNGGDGIALCRLLDNAGFNVELFIAASPEKLKGDPSINFEILKHHNIKITQLDKQTVPDLSYFDVIFDSLFGTGLSRPLEGYYALLVEAINCSGASVIAIDIPSGLSGMTSEIIGTCVKADATITFCRPKIPHCLYPARKMCGIIGVADISIPQKAVNQTNCNIFLNDIDTLPRLQKREADSHKGKSGHTCIIGGSAGKAGAALMASMSCMKTGSGLTTAVLPGNLSHAAESIYELMSYELTKSDHFGQKDFEELKPFLLDKTVIAIGPGMGTNPETEIFLNETLEKTSLPAVIDADGINNLYKGTFKHLKNRAVLTPHIGEFARLLDISTEELMKNRLKLASEFASENELVLVLKSADTLVVSPDGSIYVNLTGTPALSKGGSGDCLTGIITALISQGMELVDAARAGVWLLGTAAEKACEDIHENSVMTTDVINSIGKVLNEIC